MNPNQHWQRVYLIRQRVAEVKAAPTLWPDTPSRLAGEAARETAFCRITQAGPEIIRQHLGWFRITSAAALASREAASSALFRGRARAFDKLRRLLLPAVDAAPETAAERSLRAATAAEIDLWAASPAAQAWAEQELQQREESNRKIAEFHASVAHLPDAGSGYGMNVAEGD